MKERSSKISKTTLFLSIPSAIISSVALADALSSSALWREGEDPGKSIDYQLDFDQTPGWFTRAKYSFFDTIDFDIASVAPDTSVHFAGFSLGKQTHITESLSWYFELGINAYPELGPINTEGEPIYDKYEIGAVASTRFSYALTPHVLLHTGVDYYGESSTIGAAPVYFAGATFRFGDAVYKPLGEKKEEFSEFNVSYSELPPEKTASDTSKPKEKEDESSDDGFQNPEENESDSNETNINNAVIDEASVPKEPEIEEEVEIEKTPVAVDEPEEEQLQSEESIEGAFYVQVAAYSVEAFLKSTKKKLENRGYNTRTVEKASRGVTWLQVGPLATKQEAQDASREIGKVFNLSPLIKDESGKTLILAPANRPKNIMSKQVQNIAKVTARPMTNVSSTVSRPEVTLTSVKAPLTTALTKKSVTTTPIAPVTSGKVKQKFSGKYFIQLGIFNEKGKVKRFESELKQKGMQTRKFQPEGKDFWVLQLGPYDNYQMAYTQKTKVDKRYSRTPIVITD